MSRQRTFVEINISSIPVDGWGGLGLLSLAAVVAVTLPELRLPVLVGLGGGGALAVILVAFRRYRRSSSLGGDSPSVLFRADSEVFHVRAPRDDRSHAQLGILPSHSVRV